MNRVAACVFVVPLAFVGVARADVVHLEDGRTIEGETRWTPDGLRIDQPMGSLLIPKDQVARVEEKETPRQAVARRRGELAPDDHDGAVELARLALEHDLEEAARALALDVVAAAPDHAEARRLLRAELDFHLEDGEWVPPEEWYPAHGYVRLSGRWVTPAEAKRIRAARERSSASRDLREARQELRSADRALERADERMTEVEEELSTAVDRVEHYENEEGRITALLTKAKNELDDRRTDLEQAENAFVAARQAYHACRANPCDCDGGCSCGWAQRRIRLRNTWNLTHDRLDRTQREHRRARNRVRALENDLQEARERRRRAARTLAEAREKHIEVERELEEREARVAAAEKAVAEVQGEIDAAEQQADDAAAEAARERIEEAPPAAPADDDEAAGADGAATGGDGDAAAGDGSGAATARADRSGDAAAASGGHAPGAGRPPLLAALRGFRAGATASPDEARTALDDLRETLAAGDGSGAALRDAVVRVEYLVNRALPSAEARAATRPLSGWIRDAREAGAVSEDAASAIESGRSLASQQVVALGVLRRIAAAQESFAGLQLQEARAAADLTELSEAGLIEEGLDAGRDGYAYALRGEGTRWMAVARPTGSAEAFLAVDDRGEVHYATEPLALADDLRVPESADPVPSGQ